jgi:hypothetical protein
MGKSFVDGRGNQGQGIKGWYTPNLEGKVGKGQDAVCRFSGREPFRWRFAKLSPDTRIRWECVEGPGAEAGTTVTFRLTDAADGSTVVECDHEGWSDSDKAFATCNTLWGILIGHLRDYAETAKPVPAFR